MLKERAIPGLAALNGLLAVAIGAFGAHSLSDAQSIEWITTSILIQLSHAAAMLGLLAIRPQNTLTLCSAFFLGSGALIFATTLQALAFGAPYKIAIMAPFGGLLMIFGWVLLFGSALILQKPDQD